MRAPCFWIAAVLSAVALGAFLAHAQSSGISPAPVTSVNGAKGDVTVQTIQRQVSGSIDISSGTASWSFPAQFKNTPTCWVSVATTSAATVFSTPVTTSISTTAVTVSMRAAATVLNVLSLGAVTLWGNPPKGTIVTLSCVGAFP